MSGSVCITVIIENISRLVAEILIFHGPVCHLIDRLSSIIQFEIRKEFDRTGSGAGLIGDRNCICRIFTNRVTICRTVLSEQISGDDISASIFLVNGCVHWCDIDCDRYGCSVAIHGDSLNASV